MLLSVSGTGVKRKGQIVRKTKGMKGKTVYGAFPSKPGEPPHKQTGRLRMSAAKEIIENLLIARVGSNVKYLRPLEFGSSKMAPRPSLRRALAESRDEIEAILKG